MINSSLVAEKTVIVSVKGALCRGGALCTVSVTFES